MTESSNPKYNFSDLITGQPDQEKLNQGEKLIIAAKRVMYDMVGLGTLSNFDTLQRNNRTRNEGNQPVVYGVPAFIDFTVTFAVLQASAAHPDLAPLLIGGRFLLGVIEGLKRELKFTALDPKVLTKMYGPNSPTLQNSLVMEKSDFVTVTDSFKDLQ